MHDDSHPEPDLQTWLDADGRATVLRVSGEIDLSSADHFTAALGSAVDRSGSVIVDLRDVAFMDSTGLRALLEARRRLDTDGRTISLHLEDSGPVARLLELAGVADLFGREDPGPPAA